MRVCVSVFCVFETVLRGECKLSSFKWYFLLAALKLYFYGKSTFCLTAVQHSNFYRI